MVCGGVRRELAERRRGREWHECRQRGVGRDAGARFARWAEVAWGRAGGRAVMVRFGRASTSPPGAGGRAASRAGAPGLARFRGRRFTCRSATEATQAHLTTSQCRQSAKRGHDRPDPVRRVGQSRQRVQKKKPRPAQCPFAPCSLDLPASPADSSFFAQAADKSLQELRSLPSTSEAQLAAGWSCLLRVSAPA